jgi:hypothetical protein
MFPFIRGSEEWNLNKLLVAFLKGQHSYAESESRMRQQKWRGTSVTEQ